MNEYEKKNREAINKLIENNNLLVKANQDLLKKVEAFDTEIKLIRAEIRPKVEEKKPMEEKKPEVQAPTPAPAPIQAPASTAVSQPEPAPSTTNAKPSVS